MFLRFIIVSLYCIYILDVIVYFNFFFLLWFLFPVVIIQDKARKNKKIKEGKFIFFYQLLEIL